MLRFPRAYYEGERKEVRASTITSSTIEEALETNQVKTLQPAIEVQDAEKDRSLLNGLDVSTWLPFASKVYKISPHLEDYILVSTIICPSEIPNRNGIAFPTAELAKFQPPPMNRMVYKAWAGCPVHLEHDNEVHERAYGVILDTSFRKVQGYGGGKIWTVDGLLAIDKNKYPDVAQKVLKKVINTYSMGALVDYFQCGFCGTECSATHVCSHISSIKSVNWDVVKDWEGNSHLTFLNSFGISPIECSIVEDPAWAPALSDSVWEYEESKSPKIEPEQIVHKPKQDEPRKSIFEGFPKWGNL